MAAAVQRKAIEGAIFALTGTSGEAYCIAHHLTVDGEERRLMVAYLRYLDALWGGQMPERTGAYSVRLQLTYPPSRRNAVKSSLTFSGCSSWAQ
jgi:hypothetical protein